MAVKAGPPQPSTRSEVLPDGEFFGPELEVAIVDPETLGGANLAFEIIKAAAADRNIEYWPGVDLPGGPGHELHLSTVEYAAAKPTLLQDVWQTCQEMRLRAHDDARRAEALVMSVGTPFGSPFLAPTDWRITPLPRYLATSRSWGAAKTHQIDLGGHVHISHADPETRTLVAERMAKWGPLIVALSANSPYDEWGRDTGWASWRTRRRRADPTNPLREPARGVSDALASFERNRIGMGLPFGDMTQMHPGLRTFGNWPTIEERLGDVGGSADHDLAIIAFVGAIHHLEYEQVRREMKNGRIRKGRLQNTNDYVNAMQLAAKYGLDSVLVDPISGETNGATRVLRRLLFPGGPLHPFLKERGVWDQLEEIYEHILGPELAPQRRKGNGADQLRSAYIGIRGMLEDEGKPVVPWVAFGINNQQPMTQIEARALTAYAVARTVVGGYSMESDKRVREAVREHYELDRGRLADAANVEDVLNLRPATTLQRRSWERAGLVTGSSTLGDRGRAI